MTPGGARRVAAAALLALTAAACQAGPRPPAELRQFSDNFVIRVSSDPQPPRAREAIVWKIVVRDKETGQPIENGEGRIFATSRDGANTWDGLEPGPELGTYYGRLRFVTAGEWAVAIQFRRDSTQRLERVDWMQDVRGARGEPGP